MMAKCNVFFLVIWLKRGLFTPYLNWFPKLSSNIGKSDGKEPSFDFQFCIQILLKTFSHFALDNWFPDIVVGQPQIPSRHGRICNKRGLPARQ